MVTLCGIPLATLQVKYSQVISDKTTWQGMLNRLQMEEFIINKRENAKEEDRGDLGGGHFVLER